jgi:uncharacterized OsmC-like protein
MYKVKISGKDITEFRVKTENYEFIIDSEGENGITPPDTLLAALGSCLGVYIRKYVKNTNLNIKDFEIILSAEFGNDKPIGFKTISAVIDLKGVKLDAMRTNSLLSFVKNCPVHNTFKANPTIEASII